MTTVGDAPPSAYAVLRTMLMRQVESGELDPRADRAQVRDRLFGTVREYQAAAHLDDGLVALSSPSTMVDRLLRAVCDFGPLTDLLGREDVEEILVQGARISYITADGRVHLSAVPTSEHENRTYVDRLLQTANADRQLDASHPIVTVGLDRSTRLSVKIPPVVEELTACIRQVVLRRPTLADLVANGSLTEAAASFLRVLMRLRSRVLIAGAPFAGKTTLANALLAAIPATRVVRVNEEDRELSADLMLGGYAQANDRPGQTLRDLIKADLRFRPDVLVVGEVRGAEAFELLRPLNAGCGFLSTLHANTAADAVDVLVTCAVMAGERIDDVEIRKLFAKAIDVVVFCDADEAAGQQRRQIAEIALVGDELRGGSVIVEPLFSRETLGAPLRWTGAAPGAVLARRLERSLPDGVRLVDVLDGHVPAPREAP